MKRFLVLAMSVSLLVCLTVFAKDVAENDSMAVGNTGFNAADRLAVINLLNSYGFYYDQKQYNNWSGLFIDSPTFEIWQGDKQLLQGWTKVREMLKSRQEMFERENISRRHVLSAPRFDRQSATTCSGQVYLQLYQIKDRVPSLVTTGHYEFSAVKLHGQWKLDRWIARIDTAL